MADDAKRIIDIYTRHGMEFDRMRGRTLMERSWLDRFLARLPGTSVLDLGCGSSEPIAAHLAASGCRVTGVDASPSLIALCRERLPAHEWHLADMRALELHRRFHGILAWHSLFHLTHDDQRRMFGVFGRHAAPGAVLMFTSDSAFGEVIGSFQGEPLYHASLDPEEYRQLLRREGFHVVDYVAQDAECGDATVWLAQRG